MRGWGGGEEIFQVPFLQSAFPALSLHVFSSVSALPDLFCSARSGASQTTVPKCPSQMISNYVLQVGCTSGNFVGVGSGEVILSSLFFFHGVSGFKNSSNNNSVHDGSSGLYSCKQ